SCQVSLKPNTGPDSAQNRMIARPPAKTMGLPAASATVVASVVNSLVMPASNGAGSLGFLFHQAGTRGWIERTREGRGAQRPGQLLEGVAQRQDAGVVPARAEDRQPHRQAVDEAHRH